MRYDGTDCALMCSPIKNGPGGDIIVDDIRIRGIAKSALDKDVPISTSDSSPKPVSTTKVFFEQGYKDTNVFLLKDLGAGDTLKGPVVIMDQLSTILVEPDCTAVITAYGDIRITVGSGRIKEIGLELDSIQLSIFSHRFMSIAEQMGRLRSSSTEWLCA
ncbi:hypothetical protein NQ317_008286 [Molorchus minor]|uniref:Uncharacterized protein n=1 Tax=Molorchus minor TaxID=1323400 RepID=A0ABQ9JCM2_9CUCU|nr:hypothetical protein NQ317_008286 [Molorchus minor]